MVENQNFARLMADVSKKSTEIVKEWLKHEPQQQELDPLNLAGAFSDAMSALAKNPEKLMKAGLSFWQDYFTLWQNTARSFFNQEPAKPVIKPQNGDKRFKDEAWQDNSVFDFIKQSYLLSSKFIDALLEGADKKLDKKTAQKVDFYARQFVNAISPSNFVMTNPQVLRKTLETGGENLLKGLSNLLNDLKEGKGRLRISMTDKDAFKFGENIAVSEGSVVFRNDLLELIQYKPKTEKVYKRPLLIIPPWINKYYILDLKQSNSFVRFATEQGHTVFMVSWVNPDAKLARKRFEDYMTEGLLAALDAINEATGEKDVNVIGYCLGGTLLASSLACMAEKKDHRIKSATFLTTLIDFSESGEINVFVDEDQLRLLEGKMSKKGYLPGAEMANMFNMLRANDLIWSFVVNNYLLGNNPFPFDLLYWNSDSTRMPAAMHSFYLRKMYLENQLIVPGGISLNGIPVDIRRIKVPVFFLSAREDHIAPWKGTYLGAKLLSGPKRFVLAGSGHIAGVVNPPEAQKYNYWTNEAFPETADEWLAEAVSHPGSWWPEWQKWIDEQSSVKVPARQPGDGRLKVIEPAPGSYVRIRAEDDEQSQPLSLTKVREGKKAVQEEDGETKIKPGSGKESRTAVKKTVAKKSAGRPAVKKASLISGQKISPKKASEPAGKVVKKIIKESSVSQPAFSEAKLSEVKLSGAASSGGKPPEKTGISPHLQTLAGQTQVSAASVSVAEGKKEQNIAEKPVKK